MHELVRLAEERQAGAVAARAALIVDQGAALEEQPQAPINQVQAWLCRASLHSSDNRKDHCLVILFEATCLLAGRCRMKCLTSFKHVVCKQSCHL